MEKLDLRQALKIIRSGQVIASIKVLTADLVKKTGGQLIEYTNCRIARRQTMEASGAAVSGITGETKSANHNLHFTLNLELHNKQIRKIHPILIYELNGQKLL